MGQVEVGARPVWACGLWAGLDWWWGGGNEWKCEITFGPYAATPTIEPSRLGCARVSLRNTVSSATTLSMLKVP